MVKISLLIIIAVSIVRCMPDTSRIKSFSSMNLSKICNNLGKQGEADLAEEAEAEAAVLTEVEAEEKQKDAQSDQTFTDKSGATPTYALLNISTTEALSKDSIDSKQDVAEIQMAQQQIEAEMDVVEEEQKKEITKPLSAEEITAVCKLYSGRKVDDHLTNVQSDPNNEQWNDDSTLLDSAITPTMALVQAEEELSLLDSIKLWIEKAKEFLSGDNLLDLIHGFGGSVGVSGSIFAGMNVELDMAVLNYLNDAYAQDPSNGDKAFSVFLARNDFLATESGGGLNFSLLKALNCEHHARFAGTAIEVEVGASLFAYGHGSITYAVGFEPNDYNQVIDTVNDAAFSKEFVDLVNGHYNPDDYFAVRLKNYVFLATLNRIGGGKYSDQNRQYLKDKFFPSSANLLSWENAESVKREFISSYESPLKAYFTEKASQYTQSDYKEVGKVFNALGAGLTGCDVVAFEGHLGTSGAGLPLNFSIGSSKTVHLASLKLAHVESLLPTNFLSSLRFWGSNGRNRPDVKEALLGVSNFMSDLLKSYTRVSEIITKPYPVLGLQSQSYAVDE